MRAIANIGQVQVQVQAYEGLLWGQAQRRRRRRQQQEQQQEQPQKRAQSTAMGNEGSKPAHGRSRPRAVSGSGSTSNSNNSNSNSNSNSGNSTGTTASAAFPRTDTASSAKSAKSAKSSRSLKSRLASAGRKDSFKETSRVQQAQHESAEQPLQPLQPSQTVLTPQMASPSSHSHHQNTHITPSRRSSFLSTKSGKSQRSQRSLKSSKTSDAEHSAPTYDYIYDDEYNHDARDMDRDADTHPAPSLIPIINSNNTNSNTNNNYNYNNNNNNNNDNNGNGSHSYSNNDTDADGDIRLPPSMAILKPKSPILRMNSSTSINAPIHHMPGIERQQSLGNSNDPSNPLSRRNSTNTLNSGNSRSSRARESHGIPIEDFNNMTLNASPSAMEYALATSMGSRHSGTSSGHSRSRSLSRSSNLSSRARNSVYENANISSNEDAVISDADNNLLVENSPSSNNGVNDTHKSININSDEHLIPNNNGGNVTDLNHSTEATMDHNDMDSHDHVNGIDDQQSGGFLTSNSMSDANANVNASEIIPGTTPTTEDFPRVTDYRRKHNLNIEDLIQRLLDAGYSGKRTKSVCLKNSEIAMICSVAREIFLSQPTLLELSAPVKIVGDVHGQYTDLIRIFSKCGFPPASNYLFLGDYVDRGKQSLETILLLLCYKIKFPENFFLLRGNHECAQITRQYGFYDECKRRTNLKTWKLFVDTFNTLPIAAIVVGKIFCVHGGLSPVLNSMDEIRNIRRPTDVPDFGLLNDLLWSDPADSPNQWEDNERGVSYCFNKVAINNFLNKFQFDLVVRAHMVVEDGYEFFNDRSLVTIFSAPNYCGEFDNWGAVMGVSEELLCSFELLDPLDSLTLKQLMKKGRIERRNAMLNYTNVETVNE